MNIPAKAGIQKPRVGEFCSLPCCRRGRSNAFVSILPTEEAKTIRALPLHNGGHSTSHAAPTEITNAVDSDNSRQTEVQSGTLASCREHPPELSRISVHTPPHKILRHVRVN